MKRALASILAIAGMFLLTAGLRPAHAQQPGPVNLVYTYHVFAYDDSTSLLEFDYQFSDQGLTYFSDNGRKVGKLYLRLTIWDALDVKVGEWEWKTANPSLPGPDAQALLGAKYLAVPPGRYRAQIYYEDVGDRNRRDSAIFELPVRRINKDNLDLSDVQISTEITASGDTSNIFYKNGYLVVTNVPGMVTPPFLVLNSYVEIYNPGHVPTSEFALTYSIADSGRKIFYQKDVKYPRTDASAIVDLQSFPLEELPSGTYYLIAKAFNGLVTSATDTAIAFRSFMVYNPTKDSMVAAAGREVVKREITVEPIYSGMKEEELDIEFKKVTAIATESEKKIWNELKGVDAKGRFMTTFWLNRDPKPETEVNEGRNIYNERVEMARRLYTTPLAPNGWESDRGRVLLQYGKPDNVDRHPQDPNRRPYEIWDYMAENISFVFVDRTSNGGYMLVHSTAPREIKDEKWEENHATFMRRRGNFGE